MPKINILTPLAMQHRDGKMMNYCHVCADALAQQPKFVKSITLGGELHIL